MSERSSYYISTSAESASVRPKEVCYRYKGCLVVPEVAELPRMCIWSKDEMDSTRRVEHLLWMPMWCRVLSYIFAPLFLLVRVSSRFVCKVEFSCSPEAGGTRRMVKLVGGVLMGLLGCMLSYLLWGKGGEFEMLSFPLAVLSLGSVGVVSWVSVGLFVGMLSFFTGILLVALYGQRLRVVDMQNGWYFLKGCSVTFLEEFPELEEEYGAVIFPSEV